jgi:hypothetical protein
MNWKQFLKLSWKKIAVFVLLFIVVAYIGLSIETGQGNDTHYWIETGFPLFYIHSGDYGPHNSGFYINNLLIDLVIYFIVSYLVSSFTVLIYDKLRKK